MKRVVPLLVLPLLAVSCFAGGFTTKDALQQTQKESTTQNKQSLVGRVFYYQSKNCILNIKVTEQNDSDSNLYTTERPVRMTVKGYVDGEYPDARAYVVEFEDGLRGYIQEPEFNPIYIGSNIKKDGPGYCVTTYHPNELSKYRASARAAAEAQRQKPGVSIGMTTQQVAEQTSWGRPNKVNRTTTANGVDEQWVYNGGYLYFHNGILRSVQN